MQCGVGEYTAALAAALRRYAGCEVGVVTSPAAATSADVVATTLWSLRDARRLAGAIARWKPDVVHFQFPAQGYRGLLPYFLPPLVALRRIPVVITWHEFLDRTKLVHLPGTFVQRAMIVVRPGFREKLTPLLRWLTKSKPLAWIPNASTIPVCSHTPNQREAIRRELGGGRPLVAFFGFPYRHKGVDLLFRLADPAVHHLLIIGSLDDADPYHRELRALSEEDGWRGHVTFTGYRDAAGVGSLLAAADAVVLPFRTGGGIWNTSLHAAVQQGTFTLTTSAETSGYDAAANTYYARPENVEEMRDALQRYAGKRLPVAPDADSAAWRQIAEAHRAVYDGVIGS
jgi:glycosyltransferase involved in cell wall biosynthesis